MKLMFMGNPIFSVYILKALNESNMFDSICAVTSKDTVNGRGYKLSFSEVKKYAIENNLHLIQPENLKSDNFESDLKDYSPDIIVVASFGMLLPGYVIDYPKFGCINVHASLLPKYRGAAPINRAIINEEKETGVTIMKMDRGLDTGDMISKSYVDILPNDNYKTLHDKLALAGGELLIKTIPSILDNTAVYTHQNNDNETYAKKISEDERIINWNENAQCILNKIRGLSPNPCAYTISDRNVTIKIYSADVEESTINQINNNAGKVVEAKKSIIKVSCGKGFLLLRELQFSGGKVIKACDAINGRKLTSDSFFK